MDQPSSQVKALTDAVEAGVAAGEISHDQATAITELLKLTGDEALLACRLLGGGADPASLYYLKDGEVPEKVTLAHRGGPGVYSLNDHDRLDYLTMCHLSADEAKESTLRDRVLRFGESLMLLGAYEESSPYTEREWEWAAEEAERKYLELRYAKWQIGDLYVRLYVSDGGHAAAVWDAEDPQTRSAVFGIFGGEPYVALGAPPYEKDLEGQGFCPAMAKKQITPRFWIFTEANLIESASQALLAVGLLEESK